MMGEANAGTQPKTSSARAWFGLLMGPIAWAAQLYGGWLFGEVIACAPANRSFGRILGLHVNTFTGIVNGTLLGLTVISGIAAYTELRAHRREPDPTPGRRATELARAGIISSTLFSIMIATSFVIVAMVRCR